MEFKDILEQRYAVKKFDGSVIDEAKISQLKEYIKLAASSFGLQPYDIVIVNDAATKEKLAPASWNQPQITTCSHLFLFCANKNIKGRIDAYEEMLAKEGMPEDKRGEYIAMMRGFEEGMSPEHKLHWAQRQVYLAVGNAINGAKALGFDSCPMEGFSEEEYAKLLQIPEHLVPTCVVTVGVAADTRRKKIRFSEEVLFKEYKD